MSRLIREMEPRDAAAVCELMCQLTGQETTVENIQNRLEWVGRSPIDWLYVCEVDGQVLGLLGFRLRENLDRPTRYGEVSVLVVHASARRLGIGQALMDYAEQLAREHDCIGTWLVSGFGRVNEAHRFYESLGYHTTGYRFVKKFED